MSPVRRSKCVLAALISTHAAIAQFTVADVHTVAPGATPVLTGAIPRSNRLELRGATMVDLIRAAWEIDVDRVVGGPAWLGTDRFDVIAQAPAGSTPAAMNAMLQALLAERFSLAVHNDTRDVPTFVMTVAKSGPKMKKSDGFGDAACNQPPQNGAQAGPSYVTYVCHNMTITAFAQLLPGLGPAYFRGAALADETRLDGSWDFTVKWTARGQVAAAGPDAITMFDATEKQLGLHMELGTAPFPVIVVDSVNEKPTANLPGVSDKLPERPKEFEVAVIKPSAPGSTQSNMSFQNGRVNIQNLTLKNLLALVWDLPEDRIAGLPSFAETDRYDITAKAPADATDLDSIQAMTQALLQDRFGMTSHNEDRPIGVWLLAASKPKLRKADPGNRSACQNVASTSMIFTRSVACQNTSMAQFAAWLENSVGGYIRQHPVLDTTGLDGAWDFTLSFSGAAMAQGGGGGDGQAATDPNGAVTLFEALEKQLGLKLESRKRPMPVLVIDRIDPKPTDN